MSGVTSGVNTVQAPLTIQAGNTLALNSSSNITLSSGITGAGGLVQNGAGTVILAGSNSYTGATTVNSGVLNVTGPTLGTSAAINGGTLNLLGSNSAIATATLNAGTLNLAGGTIADNTITQNGGTLAVAGTGYTGSTFNLAGTGGTLENSTGSVISIPGGLTLAPGQTIDWTVGLGGLLTISGSNGVLGSTALSGSSFAVTVGDPVINPSIASPNMVSAPATPGATPAMSPTGNGTLITGNDNTNRIFAGVISGNGSVIKTGTGLWNLTGQNTYTGLTTVADGGLMVNGSVAGDVFVWGGVLGGSGQIGGSVLNQAIVSPGNSPGTLSIAGDYTQSSTGFLVIQVASTTVYDKLLISGQANLNGGVLVQYLNGFQLKRGDSFNFLTATGGIFGNFAQVVFPANTLLGAGLQYSADGVTLIPVQYSFAKTISGLTPNQKAVGGALDKLVNDPRAFGLIDKLDSLSLASVPNALDKIAPTDLLSMFDASINSANVQADNLERRMEEIRNGSTGFSANGLQLTNCHGTVGASGDSQQAIGKDGKALGLAPVSDRWGFFINGSGEFVDEQTSAIARGTDFTTGGVSTGADYRLGDHAAVGATAGYANTSTNGRGEGFVKTDSGKLGLYGTVFDRGFFLNSALGGGVNSFDTKRETVGGNARGDTDGTDFNALLGTGYTYRKGGLSTGPIASLRYSWVGIDGFTEKGSLAPLRFDDQSEASLKSTVGMQTAYAFNVGKVTVTPEVRAQWQHEYLDASRGIGASFLPGEAFTVYGPKIGQDSLLLDAGVTVQLTSRVGVYSFYTGDLGRQNYSSHSINGGVHITF